MAIIVQDFPCSYPSQYYSFGWKVLKLKQQLDRLNIVNIRQLLTPKGMSDYTLLRRFRKQLGLDEDVRPILGVLKQNPGYHAQIMAHIQHLFVLKELAQVLDENLSDNRLRDEQRLLREYIFQKRMIWLNIGDPKGKIAAPWETLLPWMFAPVWQMIETKEDTNGLYYTIEIGLDLHPDLVSKTVQVTRLLDLLPLLQETYQYYCQVHTHAAQCISESADLFTSSDVHYAVHQAKQQQMVLFQAEFVSVRVSPILHQQGVIQVETSYQGTKIPYSYVVTGSVEEIIKTAYLLGRCLVPLPCHLRVQQPASPSAYLSAVYAEFGVRQARKYVIDQKGGAVYEVVIEHLGHNYRVVALCQGNVIGFRCGKIQAVPAFDTFSCVEDFTEGWTLPALVGPIHEGEFALGGFEIGGEIGVLHPSKNHIIHQKIDIYQEDGVDALIPFVKYLLQCFSSSEIS